MADKARFVNEPRTEPMAIDGQSKEVLRSGWAAHVCRLCVVPGVMAGGPLPMLIEDVVEGSDLWGADGRPHPVRAAHHHHHEGTVVTIGARSVLPVTVTPEHEFLVFPALRFTRARSGWAWRQRVAPVGEEPQWRRASEVAVGDFVASPIPSIEGPEPPPMWRDPDRCWLLGLWAGNGSVTTRRMKQGDTHYHVELAHQPLEEVERAERIIADMGFKSHRSEANLSPGVEARCWKVVVSSKRLAEEVASLIGLGAANKHLPDFVWSSKERLQAAIDGYMAADGALKVDRGGRQRWVALSTSSRLLWQVWSAAVALGERPYIRAYNRLSGKANAKPAWTVEWQTGSQVQNTARHDGWYILPVVSVDTSEYEGPVVDLTVDAPHLFTVNGMGTHNCGRWHAGGMPRPFDLRDALCPRVAEVTTVRQANGATSMTIRFWQDGEYRERHDDLLEMDLWGAERAQLTDEQKAEVEATAKAEAKAAEKAEERKKDARRGVATT